MTKLKACPFCGEANLNGPHCTEYIGDHYAPHWWIECTSCPCSMEKDGETSDNIISAWNTRTPEELSDGN